MLTASDHMTLLPFGIVVEPSVYRVVYTHFGVV